MRPEGFAYFEVTVPNSKKMTTHDAREAIESLPMYGRFKIADIYIDSDENLVAAIIGSTSSPYDLVERTKMEIDYLRLYTSKISEPTFYRPEV